MVSQPPPVNEKEQERKVLRTIIAVGLYLFKDVSPAAAVEGADKLLEALNNEA